MTNLLPAKWAADIQAESQRWLLRCPACGTAQSVWERGGIRYKARSKGRLVYATCATCGQRQNMSLEWQSDE
ncbi:MAG: hypothetical protein BroJett015_46510 [Chloroflexota bacterium]|nr:MAG: hypothetical protein BroJett015_46510 [Chloroflexota bacterium]